MKICIKCKVQIPKERLEILPDTNTCVKCSSVKKVRGYQIFAHKTGGQCVTISPEDDESIRLAERAHRRAR